MDPTPTAEYFLPRNLHFQIICEISSVSVLHMQNFSSAELSMTMKMTLKSITTVFGIIKLLMFPGHDSVRNSLFPKEISRKTDKILF